MTYQHKTLVFGLASSPRLFTELILVLAAHLRRQGILFHAYLDDWLIRGPDQRTVRTHTQVALTACQRLGMRVNWGEIEPGTLTGLRVCGSEVPTGSGSSATPSRQGRETREPNQTSKRYRKILPYTIGSP